MIGYFNQKLYAAVLGNDEMRINSVVSTIKEWYDDNIVVKTYNDSRLLFEAITLNKLQNHPFDMLYITEKNEAEKRVISKTAPELKIFTYNNP